MPIDFGNVSGPRNLFPGPWGLWDLSAGPETFTLPAVVGSSGLLYPFLKVDTSANAGTINSPSTKNLGVLSAQGDQLVTYCDGTEWFLLSLLLPTKAPLNIQYLTSGVTYTPTSGTSTITVLLLAAGGGGGGAAQSAASSGGAGGGGSGGWLFVKISGIAGPYTVAVGTGGAGGVAGNNNGSNGGNTTFTFGATTYTAKGGSGGTGSAAGTIGAFVAGGNGGLVSTNGDINSGGAPGQCGVRLTGTVSAGGLGGSSPFGGGGLGATTERAGFDGTGYGSGGGGGNCLGTTQRAGGDGKPGIIIVHEFN